MSRRLLPLRFEPFIAKLEQASTEGRADFIGSLISDAEIDALKRVPARITSRREPDAALREPTTALTGPGDRIE